jgi:hypothetical protein
MDYAAGAVEHTSGYKVLPPDVATETAAPTTCDPSQQHNESEFENGDSLAVAPPISRSPEPDSGSEAATRACVNESAPPTTSGTAAACNTISPNYCPINYQNNNGYSDKLQESSIEDTTVVQGEVTDREEVEDNYDSEVNRDQDGHNNDNGLLALDGGVAGTRKRGISHQQNIIIQDEEGELLTLEKRRSVRLREEGDTLHISERDQQRGNISHEQQSGPETAAHLSYLDLRVIQQERYVPLELSNDTDTALYVRQGVKQTSPVSDRYHLDQLTAGPNNNDMPYSSSSPANSLEDLRMRHQHLAENPAADEHITADGIVLAAQSPHSFQLHGQGMRIRSDAFAFGALFPHLTTNKTIPDQHFTTSPQVLSFGVQENHQARDNEGIIDKTRSHHQVNGISDVIHATLKPEDEVNSSDKTRNERSHHNTHQYLLSRTVSSPQHQEQEEYLQRHQESSSPEIRRNGRSASPPGHHLQHHRDAILGTRTQIHNSGGGGGGGSGGGERTPLLGDSTLSSGTASASNNGSNTASFTHLTTLQPSSSSTPSPLGLGGHTTAEDGGGGSGSVLQQLSPTGDDETNEHREMYTTTHTTALEHHHHHHHLSGLHHTAGFHSHDAAAVSSASALMHSSAANITR